MASIQSHLGFGLRGIHNVDKYYRYFKGNYYIFIHCSKIGYIGNVYGHLALLGCRAPRNSYNIISYFTDKHFKSNRLSIYYFTA